MAEPATTPEPDPTRQPLPCVLACSGCSHAGELADKTARRVDAQGLAKMSCLAGVGGGVRTILSTVRNAPGILMIDGCPLECGANALRTAGISRFQHLKLNDLGVSKHTSPVDDATVQSLSASAATLIDNIRSDQTHFKNQIK